MYNRHEQDARASGAVSSDGQAAVGFTTPAMYRGMAGPEGTSVAIYAGEDTR